MATSFPGSSDVFSEPNAPASTALGLAGGSGRDHDDNHKDMADAIMAMQAQATLQVHSHNGTARNGSKLAQANTHQSADTDSSVASLHHTIDPALTNPTKGAAANHSHGANDPWPVGTVYISEVSTDPATSGLPGTWTAITSTFPVAAGATFTGGSTGGSATHTHSHSVSTDGSHSHTPAVNVADTHAHTYDGGIGNATFGHTHFMAAGGASVYVKNSGGNSVTAGGHEHDGTGANTTNHGHSPPGGSGAVGDHGHSTSASSTNTSHTHTVGSTSAESNLPAYLPVYVWYRSA